MARRFNIISNIFWLKAIIDLDLIKVFSGGIFVLKLVHAIDMDFSCVKEFYSSYATSSRRDVGCYAIYLSDDGPEKYFSYMELHEPHLYYLVDDENPNYILGYGTIEDSVILNYHLDFLNMGNIGYGVRPSERRKGYATELLRLLLLKCEEFGMYEVCVSCLRDNVASLKVIRHNGGKLEKEFFDDDTGKFGLKHWIRLHPRMVDMTKRLIQRRKSREHQKDGLR